MASESEPDPTDGSINRREYVAALSAASAGLLAGCQSGPSGGDTDTPGDGGDGMDGGDGGGGDGGDGGDGGTELGERVPQIKFAISGGLGDTTEVHKSVAPIMQENLKSIGVTTEIQPVEFLTLWSNFGSDKREFWGYGISGLGTPYDNDPVQPIQGDHIKTAGANPQFTSHWANCKGTMLIEQIKHAPSREQQTQLVHEFLKVYSEDLADMPLFTRVGYGAYRTDQITQIDVGQGIWRQNAGVLFTMQTDGDDTPVVINTDNATLQNANPTTLANLASRGWWDPVFYEPLFRYDNNWESRKGLASNFENDEFQTMTFELREDAVFHDGEPITAEDVKWTHEYHQNNAGSFQTAQDWGLDSVEVVDEHTVTFNYPQSTPSWFWQDAHAFGILPKHVWVENGAEDNPKGFKPPKDPYVASGPWELTGFRSGRFMRGEPFEDHWRTPDVSVEWQAFQDQQSMARAFRQGELNYFVGVVPSIGEDLRGADNVKVTTAPSFAFYNYTIHHAIAPTKFKEFRHAWSWSLNRKRMNEVAMFGQSTPIVYGEVNGINHNHPMFPEDHEGVTKIGVPEGDTEKAKQILREQGWGWDDQGRLHYPPDADLSPLWPQGKSPRNYPERWPCVEELGLTPTN